MPGETVKEFPLKEEFEKATGINKQDISKLREWLRTQPHLPEEHITELDLVLAYHSCARSTEVCKQVLDLHYSLKTVITRFFQQRAVDASVERALSTVLATCLPTRTREGYAIIYTHFMTSDVQHFVMSDVMKAMLMVIELAQYCEGSWPGLVMVFDLRGMTFGHMAKYDLVALQQFACFLQEALFVNLKGLYVINAPAFWDSVLGLARPFLRSSLLALVKLCKVGSSDDKDLDQFVPVAALPKEAGGQYKSVQECRDETISKLKAGLEYFSQDSRKRVVEAKRPGKPNTVSDYFHSVEGTFKQLQID